MQISPQIRFQKAAALRLIVVASLCVALIAFAVASRSGDRCGWNAAQAPNYGCGARP
jgi:hypothetical protein